jgi:hypothetical protein
MVERRSSQNRLWSRAVSSWLCNGSISHGAVTFTQSFYTQSFCNQSFAQLHEGVMAGRAAAGGPFHFFNIPLAPQKGAWRIARRPRGCGCNAPE